MDRCGIDRDAGSSSISDGRGVSPETTKLSIGFSFDDQHVAAARQCLQGRPAGISQGAPDVADGLDERILRDLAIRPDLIHDFVLADQLPGPCRKQPQHHPGARTQGDDVAAFVAQGLTGEVHDPVADNDRVLR